ncbi:alpha/beta-hydrolase [Guyanagaster necrorhizus]|uniref:Alpha/beta-hydrolase n=1 Tax=Guyanagaster necrorhizus TaxID=856835 RepID=A0A9P7VJ23_9AGAR|nr:alpha/beta-hydrolase [Guyanagaster necrorhizus MCA 3950]KAG7441445.1 alpha/beta-hydrolase [Guyanagaster necrorhizus MCA 3950]
MLLSYFDVQCTAASVPPILDIKTCVYMKPAMQKMDDPILRINPYDMSRKCDGDISILQYLDDPAIRTLLGVDPSLTANFTSCNHDDALHPTKDYVSALLERGIRVLIHVGAYDWICNWVGNERWTIALGQSGQREFAREELREWYVDEKPAGKIRSTKWLTFATVPDDKPKESLAMVQRWLRRDDFWIYSLSLL